MGKYSKRGPKKTKRRVKKGFSKKRVRKTHRRKRFIKRTLRGGTTSQPPFETDTGNEYKDKLKSLSKSEILNEHEKIMKELETLELPEDPDVVVERITQYLNSELEREKTEEKKKIYGTKNYCC